MYEIASPLSFAVLQTIQQRRQLNLDLRDSTYARLQVVTGYNPRVLVADPDFGQPEGGDGPIREAWYADSTLGEKR